jgi:nitrogen fixation NifU-like protein
VILDHAKRPRNAGALEDADASAAGHNPLCGDRLKLYLRTRGNRLERIAFEASGCAISVASASMMSEALEGKSFDESEALFEEFHDLLTGPEAAAGRSAERLGKLAVFAGVRRFPIRVKCATLAWHTLRAALRHREETVSTE